MAFNETYDLRDFNSFADFIANAKTVLEGEGVEFLFKSDTAFTDRDAMGYQVQFDGSAGSCSSSILEVTSNIHFADDDKPRICIKPRDVSNTNTLKWNTSIGSWQLRLEFDLYGSTMPENITLDGRQTENTRYTICSFTSVSGGQRLILDMCGKTWNISTPQERQWEQIQCLISSLPIIEKSGTPSSYIDDNDTSDIYDSEETPKEYSNPPKLFYMYSGLYSVNSNYADKQQEYYRKVEFKVPAGVRFCYYTDNESRSNVMLKIAPCEFEFREYSNGSWSQWQSTTDLSIYANHYFADIDDDNYIEFNGRFYYSSCNTNIPKAKNEEDAFSYLEYDINDDEMYIQQKEHPNKSGDSLDSQTSDLQDNTVRAILSRLYKFDYANLVKISNVIFNSNAGEMEDLLKGLEMYGNNPIACITDLYYTPIDLSDFIDATITNSVKFGSYLAEPSGLSVSQINFNHGIKTLANTFIHGQYGDWRDTYVVRYKLYLPFVGIVDLDANKYVNRTLTIKVTYDLRSHNMKYYLFADSKLLQTYEASLGVNMVIMGNDTSAKASQNIQSMLGMAHGTTSLALSVGAPVNPVGIASSIGDMAMNVGSAILNMTKEAPTTITGNVSPASACNDIFYPYLIIETQEHDYPSLLVNKFGMPCNVVNRVGNSKGFTIADNINLEGNMLDAEKKEIISLFKGGVII